jgi:polyisoprenoid-binding protein YceI
MLGLVATSVPFAAMANAAENYRIDPAHSSLTFSVRHLGINYVKGYFDDFAGSIVMDGGEIKEATCTIQVKSINTGVKQRDDHLRTPDFFDAAKFPVMAFKSKRVEKREGLVVLIADFTIRDVTKEIRLPVKLSGPVKDQQGNTRIGFEAKLTLNRKDYGINFNAALETGAAVVGEDVAIEINAEAIKENGK